MFHKFTARPYLSMYLRLMVIGTLLWAVIPSNQAQAQDSTDVSVEISFGNIPTEQNVGSYTDIQVQITLANNAPSGDLIDVSLTLSTSGGGTFPTRSEDDDFKAIPGSSEQETRADRKLGPGNSRVLGAVFRPNTDAIGVYAITVAVSVNGQLREDLSKSATVWLGVDRINALESLVGAGEIASGVIEGELIGSTDTVSLSYLVTNLTEGDDEFTVTLVTFGGITFLGNELSLSSNWALRKGELRVEQVLIKAQADAPPGRYTVRLQVTSKNHPDVSFEKLIAVGYGPYKYAPPAASDVGSSQLNLYLNSIAVPGSVSRLSGTIGELHVWIENTSPISSVRSVEVSVINGTEEIMILDANGYPATPDNYSRTISNIALGPQEGVLIIAQYRVPKNLSAGIYSFEIMARDPSSGASEPLRIRQDITLN